MLLHWFCLLCGLKKTKVQKVLKQPLFSPSLSLTFGPARLPSFLFFLFPHGPFPSPTRRPIHPLRPTLLPTPSLSPADGQGPPVNISPNLHPTAPHGWPHRHLSSLPRSSPSLPQAQDSMRRLPRTASTSLHLLKPPPTEAPTDINGAFNELASLTALGTPSPLHL
jgi:hypothetical protein